jgi:hypothetical protein
MSHSQIVTLDILFFIRRARRNARSGAFSAIWIHLFFAVHIEGIPSLTGTRFTSIGKGLVDWAGNWLQLTVPEEHAAKKKFVLPGGT